MAARVPSLATSTMRFIATCSPKIAAPPRSRCGGCFFFTVNLAERHLHLLTEHIDKLRTAFRETRRHHPFTIDAMVVLPDHLHTLWTLPEGDADFAARWRLIKSAFSRSLTTGERISESRA